MLGTGATLVAPLEELSAMGFVETLGSIPRHYRLYRDLLARASRGHYAAAVLIDYPGFHLRLGAALRKLDIPVIQFVAPQFWAWRPGRLDLLRRAVTAVAAVLPFEEQWLRARGVMTRFVGHPAIDQPRPSRDAARSALQVVAGQRVLSIFPGSRAADVRRHWPLFRDAAMLLLEDGRCDVVLVAAVTGREYPAPRRVQLIFDRAPEVMAASTATLIKSGTAALEAALAGTPVVVAYRASQSTYRIARRLMTVDRISLVNLIADRSVVPELWHLPVTLEQITSALRPLLDEQSEASRLQRAGLAQVVAAMGPPGAADRVASMVLEQLAP